MSSFFIALMFGTGIGGFLWAKLAHSSGNADPRTTYGGAAAGALLAFLFFFSLLKWVIHID